MMFEFKKILTSLLLPPGLLEVLALLLGLLLFRRREKLGLFSLFLAALIYFFSIGPVANGLMGPLERHWPLPGNITGQVIVVLGGGVYSGVPDNSGRGFPAEATLSRMITAFRLHGATGAPIIISGGAVFPGKTSEASVAKRILTDLGIPGEQIIVEDQSRDTRENARFVKAILQRRNWRQVILVTSAFHLDRSVLAFRQAGLEVRPYPADFRVAASQPFGWSDFLPSAKYLARSALALHEYLGLWFYKRAY